MKVHELHHSLVLLGQYFLDSFMDGSLDSFMHSVWTRFGFYCVVGKENFAVFTKHALTCWRVSWIWHHLPKIYLPTKDNFFLVSYRSLGLVSMWPTRPTIFDKYTIQSFQFV